MTSMPEFAMTYVVYWPHAGVLKVGRAWKFHRVQMMVRSGAQIIVLARGTDSTWEREALAVMRRWFPRAFTRERDAEQLLFMGRGFTECFRVDEAHLQLAVDLCFEGFAKGNDQGWNADDAQTTAGDQARAMDRPRTVESAEDGATNGDGVVGDRGRRGPDRASAGPDRGADLPGRSDNHDRAHRDAPARARRCRVPDHLPGGWPVLGADHEPADDSASASFDGTAAPVVPSGTFRKLHGCGGRERASWGGGRGCRESEPVGRVGGSAGARSQTLETSTARRSAHRLPRPSQWQVRGLWALRYSSPPSRQMGVAAALSRAGLAVREFD